MSTTDLLLDYGAEEGSAAYLGFERVVGRVHGRPGSFVLHRTATSSPDGRAATWSVAPDTGTCGLLGLRGEAEISIAPDGATLSLWTTTLLDPPFRSDIGRIARGAAHDFANPRSPTRLGK